MARFRHEVYAVPFYPINLLYIQQDHTSNQQYQAHRRGQASEPNNSADSGGGTSSSSFADVPLAFSSGSPTSTRSSSLSSQLSGVTVAIVSGATAVPHEYGPVIGTWADITDRNRDLIDRLHRRERPADQGMVFLIRYLRC